MNIKKIKIYNLPYDILMIVIKYTCYRSMLNLICTNNFFYNIYSELNKYKKENMLECASILINNGFKVYGKFCRDLLNDTCPKTINLFCFIANSNKNELCSKINQNKYDNYLSLPNNLKKYIKRIENNRMCNNKDINKITISYFVDIFKNNISISDVVILKNSCSIFVVIYFKETYIELQIDFPNIVDINYDFWCNSLVLSLIKKNNNNITKKDILNALNYGKYSTKVNLTQLIEDENFQLRDIIKSIKEKIAVPINQNIHLKQENNCMTLQRKTNNFENKNTEKKCRYENYKNIIKLIDNYHIYRNNNLKNLSDIKLDRYNCFKKFDIYDEYICGDKYYKYYKHNNNIINYILEFQKKFLDAELSGFKILMDNTYVNYKQIKWSNINKKQ